VGIERFPPLFRSDGSGRGKEGLKYPAYLGRC
jgi:hypothetical protein